MKESKAEKTKKNLLIYAKTEFSEHGFLDASMRSIAKKAGMTTGAIYRYYPDKNTLFTAIVEPSANEIKQHFQALASLQMKRLEETDSLEDFAASKKGLLAVVDFLFSKYEVFDLLINRSAGSSWEHFIDSLIDLDLAATQAYLEQMVSQKLLEQFPSPHYLAILVKQSYKQVLQIITLQMNREEAIEYMQILIPFLYGGWHAVLERKS